MGEIFHFIINIVKTKRLMRDRRRITARSSKRSNRRWISTRSLRRNNGKWIFTKSLRRNNGRRILTRSLSKILTQSAHWIHVGCVVIDVVIAV